MTPPRPPTVRPDPWDVLGRNGTVSSPSRRLKLTVNQNETVSCIRDDAWDWAGVVPPSSAAAHGARDWRAVPTWLASEGRSPRAGRGFDPARFPIATTAIAWGDAPRVPVSQPPRETGGRPCTVSNHCCCRLRVATGHKRPRFRTPADRGPSHDSPAGQPRRHPSANLAGGRLPHSQLPARGCAQSCRHYITGNGAGPCRPVAGAARVSRGESSFHDPSCPRETRPPVATNPYARLRFRRACQPIRPRPPPAVFRKPVAPLPSAGYPKR